MQTEPEQWAILAGYKEWNRRFPLVLYATHQANRNTCNKIIMTSYGLGHHYVFACKPTTPPPLSFLAGNLTLFSSPTHFSLALERLPKLFYQQRRQLRFFGFPSWVQFGGASLTWFGVVLPTSRSQEEAIWRLQSSSPIVNKGYF